MSTILSFLSNIKLTIVQWVGVAAAATIGILVLLLKAQGSRLHKAQVDLLSSQLGRETDKADERVAALQVLFDKAKKEYEDAK